VKKRAIITLGAAAIILGVLGAGVTFVTRQFPSEPAFYHYVRTDGRVETPFSREELAEPLFVVTLDGKQGYIDVEGNLTIPLRFDQAHPFSGGVAAVSIEGLWGLIDTEGSFVIEPQFAHIGFFKDGLAPARKKFGDRTGYIDDTGSFVIEARYDTATPFFEGVARVGVETTWSKLQHKFADVGLLCRYRYIDQQGRYVEKPAGFRSGFPPTPPGIRPARDSGRWGYVDDAGTWVISAQFEKAFPFSEGLAAVRTDEGCGFIDEHGDFVIGPRFGYAFGFSGGLAKVTVKDKGGQILTGYIDRTGNYVWPPSK
jgi:hypothetical protein